MGVLGVLTPAPPSETSPRQQIAHPHLAQLAGNVSGTQRAVPEDEPYYDRQAKLLFRAGNKPPFTAMHLRSVP